MKIYRGLGVAGALAVVPLVLGMSAAPASAMQKSCLSMRIEYEQASLTSSHASATMTSFEDNVQWYADSNGFLREKGWYYGFDGSMQRYDLDPSTWTYWDDFNKDRAAEAEADMDAAYDAYVTDCGW